MTSPVSVQNPSVPAAEVAAPPEGRGIPRIAEPAEWPIAPGTRMLNHGSYGIVPKAVQRAQDELRALMNADPIRWFKVHQERLADKARSALAGFVNAEFESLTFVPNATMGIATILHSIDWQPGDEVVVTDHEYQATLNELDRMVRRRGIAVKTAAIPLPLDGPGTVIERVLSAVTDRTRLVIVSHVASASALVFPVDDIVRELRHRGVEVLVDGAHAPGQVEVDLRALRPTYYAASCHKWLCTPKGSGFIYADAARRDTIRPLALSCRVHEVRDDRPSYLSDFDYTGTGDTTPSLVIPHAIAHLGGQLEGGWPALRERNRRAVLAGAGVVAERCGLRAAGPETMTASMVSLLLPPDPAPGRPSNFDDPLWDELLDRHGVQVPVWTFAPAGVRVLRVSAHLHTSPEDFAVLGEALSAELARERDLST